MKMYPPIIALIYLLVFLMLNYVFPGIKIIYAPYSYLGGIILIGGGIAFMVWASKMFRKNNTTHDPYGLPTSLVINGPFRISRNPMYLGLSLVLLGIAFFIGRILLFFVPLSFLLTMNMIFIPWEERNLRKIFGKEYLNYINKVRRWL